MKRLPNAALAASLLVAATACDENLASVDALHALREVEALKTDLLLTATGHNLITAVDTTGGEIVIHLEDGQTLSGSSSLFGDVVARPDAWEVEFSFPATAEALVLPFRGDSFGLALAPNGDEAVFPLLQALEASLPFPGRLAYAVRGKSGAAGDIRSPAFQATAHERFSVFGLYPGYDNQIVVDYFSASGVLRASEGLTTTRAALDLPDIEVVERDGDGEGARLFLTAHRSDDRPIVVDQFGDVRWSAALVAKYGLQQAKNGNLLFTDADQVFEVSLEGGIVRSYRLPRPYISIHHDIHETRSGDLLLTVDNEDLATREDIVVLLDRELGQVTRVWDLNVSIPRNYELIRDTVDWLHVNAVTFDERDQSLVISGQRRGLFKVSWDNDLVWILSDPLGFESVPELLLDSDEIFWGQHDVRIDEDNDVYYVFDNGLGRNYSNDVRFSRGVRFSVDEEAMTATALQEYGTAYPEYFSPIISGIDYEPGGGVLVNFGSIGYDFNYVDPTDIQGGSIIKPNPEYGAAWVEFDAVGEVRLHMRFSRALDSGLDPGIYRARYLDAFRSWQ